MIRLHQRKKVTRWRALRNYGNAIRDLGAVYCKYMEEREAAFLRALGAGKKGDIIVSLEAPNDHPLDFTGGLRSYLLSRRDFRIVPGNRTRAAAIHHGIRDTV